MNAIYRGADPSNDTSTLQMHQSTSLCRVFVLWRCRGCCESRSSPGTRVYFQLSLHWSALCLEKPASTYETLSGWLCPTLYLSGTSTGLGKILYGRRWSERHLSFSQWLIARGNVPRCNRQSYVKAFCLTSHGSLTFLDLLAFNKCVIKRVSFWRTPAWGYMGIVGIKNSLCICVNWWEWNFRWLETNI